MNKFYPIYNKLYKEFGPQHWWPVTEKGLRPSYNNGPENEKHRFEICVGAILTQNTNWKNVEKAIYQLNKNKLMDVFKIKKINQKRLAKLIKSSGYFNQKAERLKLFSSYLVKNYNGSLRKLFDKEIQDLRNELLALKGIGPETADSIILYSAEKPIFVIDAYTKRIFSRLGICKEDVSYDELQALFMKNLKHDHKMFNEYHALLVEVGKRKNFDLKELNKKL